MSALRTIFAGLAGFARCITAPRLRPSIRTALAVFAAACALPAAAQGEMAFRIQPITDPQQGGLVVATVNVPVQWRVTSQVRWNYADVSVPVRAAARIEAPDGSAWIEFFPNELFYWLSPVRATVGVGQRSLGMVYLPNVTLEQAMRQYVLQAHRGRMPDLQLLAQQPVDAARLSRAFGQPASGQAMRLRVRYTLAGRPVEEDLYGLLTDGNRVPYNGPQGTWYESHRMLAFAHGLGAAAGTLDQVYPLLSYIATTLRIDPQWLQRRSQVEQAIAAEFNRNIARGYSQIQAAAQMSRTISANNDAMLASMQAQRAAQAQRDAALRAAANATGGGHGSFSDYLRGTTQMKDPYWGESAQSSNYRYHWTDGQGNYRSSNDAGFDPNVGAGGGPNWTLMQPAR